MFPDSWHANHWLWLAAAGAGVIYLVLFVFARRPVALRLRRLGWMAFAVLALRGGLLLLDYPLTTLEGIMAGVLLACAVGLWLAARIWLVRAEAETLREQIQSACQSLFLGCEEQPPGRFLLTAKGSTQHVYVKQISRRIQLVRIPRPVGPGKVALLVQWLAKQYPGPIPRIHIVLKRREPCPTEASK